MNSLRAVAVRVPCSTSNLGAGFDCLGLAFQRYLTVRFEPEARGGVAVEYAGTLAGRGDPGDDIVVRAFLDRCAQQGIRVGGGAFHLDSDIPVARGLGSSAAATVAGLLLADLARGREVDREGLLAVATEREGHPDNAAPALLGGLVAVARDERGEPHAFPLELADGIGFVYAAPELELSTPHARAVLPRDVPHARAVRSLGRTAALVRGLASGDPELLRLGLLDELHVPYRAPLIPHADEAMAAAAEAGAFGATISGSGSGLIALCPPGREAPVLQAMLAALERGGRGAAGFVAEPDFAGARALAVDAEAAC